MAGKKPNEMGNEELLKAEKTNKMLTYMLISMMILMFLSGVFLSFKKGFSAFIAVPVAFLPIVIVNANALKAIKEEKEVRGL